jgi:imidazole glycerol-phosphate synthase subunit HisF
MINKRIIPVVIIRNGLVVQSYNFSRYLPIGRPKFIVEYLSSWDCDEILVVDIDASREKRHVNTALITELSGHVSVPLTIGGGITGLRVAELYFKNGADKVSINSLFTEGKYDDINAISEEYGSQSTLLSLDFVEDPELQYSLYDHKKRLNLKKPIADVITEIRNNVEVGEILVNSVNRDGSKLGYDRSLMKSVADSINKPILALGGVDTTDHFLSLFDVNNITGLCAANVFLHSEHSVEVFRSKLNREKKILRPNNYFSYE